MIKKVIGSFAFLIFINSNFAQAKVYSSDSSVVLSDEFLSSLNQEQLEYLEAELGDVIPEDNDQGGDTWEHFDMDEIELTAVSEVVDEPGEKPTRD